jgi:glutamyl-tRNA synthetase
MSKRKTVSADGREYNVMIREFRAAGYLPEAMFNSLALIGWSYDDKTEILTREQIIQNFDLDHVSAAPAKFSYDKLDWMNGVYIRSLEVDDLAARILPFLSRAGLNADADTVRRITPLIQERVVTLADAVAWTDFVFVDELDYDPQLLVQKKMTAEQARQVLAESEQVLEALPTFDEAEIEDALRAKAEEMGLKVRQFFGTLRIATTGKKVAPPLFGTLAILGREKVLARIARAQELLTE